MTDTLKLSSLDLSLWITLIAGKFMLCFCIVRKSFFHRLPWFSAYIFASTCKSLVLLTLAFWGSYASYYYTFHTAARVILIVALLALIESARQVFPGLKLPQRERALGWLLAALGAVAAFSALWPLRSVEDRIEVACYLAGAVTFISVAAYSRYLGLYWSRLLAGVTSTLGLLYLVEGSVRAMTGHYPSVLVLQVRQISPIANVLAVVAWAVVILSPWGEYRLTPEQLRALKRNVDAIEANLRDLAREAEKVA